MTETAHRFELLADLAAMIAGESLLDDLITTLAARVATALGADRATLWLIDEETGDIRSKVATLPELAELRVRANQGVVGHVAKTGKLVNLSDVSADARWAADIAATTGFKPGPMLTVPVLGRGAVVGVLQVMGRASQATVPPLGFSCDDEQFATALADQIGRALDYTSLRGNDKRAGLLLRGRFNHVIGDSPAIAAVYDTIALAAKTDATVLVRGETGTGKGLLARAIAVNSKRRDAPFVHIDCTTLPAGLVESELFGHERGAYTGADARVVGKVEAAHGGTLFLDELGELPLALQAKLLRFVQERTFERVGGRETLSADVRIIAATNRDLATLVAQGQFRADLYYRLRVIEVEVPPLRERGERDILHLAEHFLYHFARRYQKAPTLSGLADDARQALIDYPWPGNVRELENTLERAVVLCSGDVITKRELRLDVGKPAATAAASATNQLANRLVGAVDRGNVTDGATDGTVAPSADDDRVALATTMTLAAAERAFAVAVLRRCDNNQTLAAKRLGISRNKLARLLK